MKDVINYIIIILYILLISFLSTLLLRKAARKHIGRSNSLQFLIAIAFLSILYAYLSDLKILSGVFLRILAALIFIAASGFFVKLFYGYKGSHAVLLGFLFFIFLNPFTAGVLSLLLHDPTNPEVIASLKSKVPRDLPDNISINLEYIVGNKYRVYYFLGTSEKKEVDVTFDIWYLENDNKARENADYEIRLHKALGLIEGEPKAIGSQKAVVLGKTFEDEELMAYIWTQDRYTIRIFGGAADRQKLTWMMDLLASKAIGT